MVAIVKSSSFSRFSNLSFISFINVSVILETPLDLITIVNTTFNVETSGITSDKHDSAELLVFVNSSKGLRILIQLFKMSFLSAVSNFLLSADVDAVADIRGCGYWKNDADIRSCGCGCGYPVHL